MFKKRSKETKAREAAMNAQELEQLQAKKLRRQEKFDQQISDDFDKDQEELKKQTEPVGTFTTYYLLHEVEPEKLASITELMREYGAPTIRYLEVDGERYALEGTHRLHAAKNLNLTPEWLEQDDSAPIPPDLEIESSWAGEIITVGALIPFLTKHFPLSFEE